jgi:hypothetical protein
LASPFSKVNSREQCKKHLICNIKADIRRGEENRRGISKIFFFNSMLYRGASKMFKGGSEPK